MELITGLSIFSLGAGGMLSFVKLLQAVQRRRAAKAEEDEPESGPDEVKPMKELFPNGEKRQVIREIARLRRESDRLQLAHEALLDGQTELKTALQKIAVHLRIEL